MESNVERPPLKIVTYAREVHPDEKAWRLSEMDIIQSDYRGRRRYQLIYVERGGALKPYLEDLGPADDALPPFDIPSFFEHSVGELKDLADQLRDDNALQKRLREKQEGSTLINDAIAFIEQADKLRNNRSLSGPGGLRQRTGFHIG